MVYIPQTLASNLLIKSGGANNRWFTISVTSTTVSGCNQLHKTPTFQTLPFPDMNKNHLLSSPTHQQHSIHLFFFYTEITNTTTTRQQSLGQQLRRGQTDMQNDGNGSIQVICEGGKSDTLPPVEM